MPFELTNAIQLRQNYVDQSHRFWGYFQLAAAAAIGLAWSNPMPGATTIYGLAAGFFLFGLGNGRLVVSAQKAAVDMSSAIDSYVVAYPAQVPTEFLPVVNALELDGMRPVWLLHLGLTILVPIVILSRLAIASGPP